MLAPGRMPRDSRSGDCLSQRKQNEWNVPNVGASSEGVSPNRSLISLAALFVNVNANMSRGRCRLDEIKCRIFSMITVVFPVPAPAIITWGVP